MTRKLPFSLVKTVVLALFGFGLHPLPASAGTGERWVGTWTAALHAPSPGPPGLTNPGFDDRTLRQIVHTSVGGNRVRVRLSTLGAGPVVIGAARIARRAVDAVVDPGSDRALTFAGEPSIRIPAGAVVLSDPVELDVPALSDLAISVFVRGPAAPATWHFVASQTSYVSPPGDFTETIAMPVESTTAAWFWLAGVDVTVSKQTGAIVAFGDSVTDGRGSTPDLNRRWPDYLARRLMAEPGNQQLAVLNAGLTGNRLVNDGIGSNGVARFDRDVLMQSGVTHVIVLLGNNDILFGPIFPGEAVTANLITHAHQVLIIRARALGLKVIGATLPPVKSAVDPALFPAIEAMRQAVNAWIRTSGAYDAVVDFDAVLRDPEDPAQMLGKYRADNLHPNDLGSEAMANAIDLALFTRAER